ncbi:hypothetical protein Tco_0105808 [Tanacetum coccineum]
MAALEARHTMLVGDTDTTIIHERDEGNMWVLKALDMMIMYDDLLQKDLNKQESVKDDKGNRLLKDDKGKLTGIKSVDDLEKRIQNVKEVMYKAKEEMLMKKDSSSKSYKAELRSSFKDLQADVGASAGSFTLLVSTKRPPPIRNCILGLSVVRNWGLILNKEFGIRKPKEDVGSSADVAKKGKRKMV